MSRTVAVQTAPFQLEDEIAHLHAGRTDIGALVTFTGYVRDFNERPDVEALVLEHYPGMTESVLMQLLEEAAERFELTAARLIHRVGRLTPGDPIVLVITASAHRQQAFDACAWLMDFLKTRAPFWKKEQTATGEYWVSARQSDTNAAQRWEGA
ncbi:molybdopterin synthase catalytic subunit MoaE [Marinospirillum sp.]|uniref:molybdopterin synthase catalytic subunit MoaE n=1 Tax=Marinospirillum sp. TaxID=2183934 RepID=UPI003A8951EF